MLLGRLDRDDCLMAKKPIRHPQNYLVNGTVIFCFVIGDPSLWMDKILSYVKLPTILKYHFFFTPPPLAIAFRLSICFFFVLVARSLARVELQFTQGHTQRRYLDDLILGYVPYQLLDVHLPGRTTSAVCFLLPISFL